MKEKQGIHNGLKENAMDLLMFTLIIVTFILSKSARFNYQQISFLKDLLSKGKYDSKKLWVFQIKPGIMSIVTRTLH